MQIITTKCFLFKDATIQDIVCTDANGVESITKTEVIHQSIRVNPSSFPQTVPDYVKDDPLFELAVNDGAIVVV